MLCDCMIKLVISESLAHAFNNSKDQKRLTHSRFTSSQLTEEIPLVVQLFKENPTAGFLKYVT